MGRDIPYHHLEGLWCTASSSINTVRLVVSCTVSYGYARRIFWNASQCPLPQSCSATSPYLIGWSCIRPLCRRWRHRCQSSYGHQIHRKAIKNLYLHTMWCYQWSIVSPSKSTFLPYFLNVCEPLLSNGSRTFKNYGEILFFDGETIDHRSP